MSHSPDAEDFVVAEWRAALADTGVSEAGFHLITCPGAAVTGHAKAVSFDPGRVLYGDAEEGGILVQPHKLAEANDAPNLYRHRVAVLEDVDADDAVEVAYLAGVLRHEIEHAKQPRRGLRGVRRLRDRRSGRAPRRRRRHRALPRHRQCLADRGRRQRRRRDIRTRAPLPRGRRSPRWA